MAAEGSSSSLQHSLLRHSRSPLRSCQRWQRRQAEAGQRRQVRQRNMARTTLEPDWMSGSVWLQRGRGNLKGHLFNNRGR